MADFFEAPRSRPREATIAAYTAQVLNAADRTDNAILDQLRADPCIEVIDHHAQQLEELRALRPLPAAELLGEGRRWAYYPWRRTVVAVLGPRGFRMLRLDRNRNRITAEEQARLATLRIGVAGLSVGHVIAHTLAAQGLCGELRLADFDRVDLSNLNRVPGTVLDLGLNKATVAARRIAELDPYLPVQVSTTGLTVDTVDEFLDGLDIVVEECDSLDIKAVVREGARARRLPVLMATSDRGLMDVERFDCDPQRPILHGLLGDLDTSRLVGMTSREKVPHMLRFLEAQALSSRIAASAVEIDRTLSTWPQLAGEVVLGATTVAEAVRRIGLGEQLRSGRIRFDVGSALDQLDEPPTSADRVAPPVDSPSPTPMDVAGIVTAAAIRAPSAGNAQPWQIGASPERISIRLAPQYTSSLDVGFRASAVAVGAALFNAKVAAAAQQVLGPARFSEDGGDVPLQATLELADRSDPDLAALYRPMLARETNRRLGTQQLISADIVDQLSTAAEREGGRLHVITSPHGIAQLAANFAAADRTRYLTPGLHAEMVSELRWPDDEHLDSGIDVHSLELEPGEVALLGILRRADVMALLQQWNGGGALGEDTRRRLSASSAVGVVSVPKGTLTDYARGGSAAEAVWVTAQQCGLAVQPVSPVYLYAHNRGDLMTLSAPFSQELSDLQADFLRMVGIPTGAAVALVLRFAVGSRASVRSRRNLDRVSAGITRV